MNELSRWPGVRPVSRLALAAVAYYASARVGYAFAIPQSFVTLWPPAGVMLALLALSDRRDWPALLAGGIVGSISSDLRSGYSFGLAVAASLANGSETALAAWVVTRRAGSPVRLSSLRSVAELTIGAAIVANGLTSILGALMLHFGFRTSFGTGWLTWWVGDGLGMLIIAPAILTWANASSYRIAISWARILEGFAALTCLSVMLHEVFGLEPYWAARPGPYAVFPFLLWAGLRFGPIGAATSTLIVASYATWDAALGVSPLVSASAVTIDTALQVYTFLLVAALCALLPAVALEERTVAERRRRESEERLQFAMKAAGLGVWDEEVTTGKTRWSDTLEALHGLATGSFGGTQQAFLEHIHPDDREVVAQAIATSARDRTDSNVVYRSVWPDGSTHWISRMGRTVYDTRGAPVRAAGIGLDVTEQHVLEEHVRQAQKMDAVGQLAGGIAHDFNNLLTVILSYASIAMQGLEGRPERADVEEIKLAAERAASLTRQLLAFSRRQILAPRVLNVAQSLRAMEPMLRRLIGEDIEIVVQAADVGMVRADPTQIEQIILNLALNSRDAMPTGGVLHLEVAHALIGTAEERRHGDVTPGSYVMLAVTDTGVGMDEATLARVFEPFFTTKPQGKGTGIGLATVHGIVKQTGGALWAYSEVGRGTTFKVYLPRIDEAADAVPGLVDDAGPKHSETVLITEDDDRLRALAARILESRGYLVLTAGTPSEALMITAQHEGRIHLLLSDVVLPEMSGPVLAQAVVARRRDIKVLYMSGYTDDAVVRRGVLERGTRFVQKPFDPATLLRKVREALDDG